MRSWSLTARLRVDKLANMTPFERDIRFRLLERLSLAHGVSVRVARLHLPARNAHASIHVLPGAEKAIPAPSDFGLLFGVPLVDSVRVVNGWLLLDFSPAFFSALVEEINRTLPAPANVLDTHAQNRMYALCRHAGEGCPDIPAFHRALIAALVAHESPASYLRAERAAEALLHSIPPRERPALLPLCGALGSALLRLLSPSR